MVFEVALSNFFIILDKLQVFTSSVWDRFLELLYAPSKFPEMIWILIPVALTLLIIEFYFGVYVDEELGWNTAFANSLVLIFVSLDLARYLYNKGLLFHDDIKTIIVFTVLLEGILISLTDFLHLMPKRLAFKFSSSLPINFVAYMSIILVYTSIKVDYITISAFLLFLIFLSLIIGAIHFLEPHVRRSILQEPLS